jgi:putative transposase
MKQKRFSETEILQILKQAEQGVAVPVLCRERGMNNDNFYKWRSKYGGMDASLICEMKSLAEENKRLKRMYTKIQMRNDMLKEAL